MVRRLDVLQYVWRRSIRSMRAFDFEVTPLSERAAEPGNNSWLDEPSHSLQRARAQPSRADGAPTRFRVDHMAKEHVIMMLVAAETARRRAISNDTSLSGGPCRAMSRRAALRPSLGGVGYFFIACEAGGQPH